MLDKATQKRLAKRLAASPRDKLTQAQRDAIAKRYANNESVVSIAHDFKVSTVTVYKWVRVAAKENER